jgi:hypothetical protein
MIPEYKDLTLEKIEAAIKKLFYKNEVKGTLPITINIYNTNSQFLVVMNASNGTLHTGIGGFINFIKFNSELTYVNLYVNSILLIGEKKQEFIKITKERYENTSASGS